MEAVAKLSYVRLSPQKSRLVVDLVRGKGVQEVLNILKFSPNKAAPVVAKLISSAVANAEQKGVSDVDRLFVKTITVDGGPVLRRFMPRAQGRATRIRKPTSHIKVILAEK
ncbi:MAG: 50S ribosomal protein L22 [Deltaproteobacteria bacterium]|nr:50S ribosomal protein L22 [Deltaproteobacteria bacterium]